MIDKMINTQRFYVLLFMLLMCVISCSDSVPKIQDVYYHNYSNTEYDRLAVFVELQSSVENIEKLTITHRASHKEWIITNPVIIKDTKSSTYYCGSFNIVPENDGVFVNGEYKIVYYDRAGRSTETYFLYKK